jgi:hypothetical protein
LAHSDTAHAAELVATTIVISTNWACSRSRIAIYFLGHVIGSLLGVVLGGQALCGLESCGNGFGTGFGTAHFRDNLTVNIVNIGVAHRRLRRRTGMSGRLFVFVFIHESNHPNSGVILA